MPRTRSSLGVWVSWLLAFLVAYPLSAAPAHAQDGEVEVIDDPELADTPLASSASDGDGEIIIDDPELAGLSSSSDSESTALCAGGDAPQSDVRLVLHLRGNRDLVQDDPREEIWEGTGALILEGTLRRTRRLKFGLGVIARYHYAALAADVADATAPRYELGLLPTAAYVDTSPVDGLHVRAGYQTVALGRFDVFSATNVLTVNDMRDGPSAIPGTTEIGQLGLLIDYDPVPWLSMRAIYLPFFMPHVIAVTDSDYALFPGNQADTDASIMAFEDILPLDELRAQLKNQLRRSARDQIASSTLSAFAPSPTLLHPQGALRVGTHGLLGELAFTFATALEHLPAFRLSDAAIQLLSNPDQDAGSADPEPLRVEYNRFAVLSADAAIDLPPFSLGFELAYQLHRTLYAVGTAYPGDPYAVPVPGFTDILQGGARVEWMHGTTWLFATELFAALAVQLPDDTRRGWMFLEDGRLYRGAGALLGYTADFGLQLQLSAAWLSGPTVIAAPRIAYAVVPELELELGAFIIDGQRPPTLFVTPILSAGGIFHNLDHVFAGIRGTL